MKNTDFHGDEVGRWPFKSTWISICGVHYKTDTYCTNCQRGYYRNSAGMSLEQIIFKCTPSIWRWWANRPNSPRKRFLVNTFPRLKKYR